MKTSPFSRIFLSALCYATLLCTMFVIPLVLAARYDAGMANADRDARSWKRLLDSQAKVVPHRVLPVPRSDAPLPGSAAKQAPIAKSGPDTAMIKNGKARAKTIRL